LDNVLPFGYESSLIFPRSLLEHITNGFDDSKKIGEGGSGKVYKGRLNQIPVAIKRLTEHNSNPKQFQAEIINASKYRHEYVLPIYGFTDLAEKEACIIYPLMPQGSLRDRLNCRENTTALPWDTRVKIAFQTAAALSFLHCPFQGAQQLAHLDIKSDNILLDDKLNSTIIETAAPFGTLGIQKSKKWNKGRQIIKSNQPVTLLQKLF